MVRVDYRDPEETEPQMAGCVGVGRAASSVARWRGVGCPSPSRAGAAWHPRGPWMVEATPTGSASRVRVAAVGPCAATRPRRMALKCCTALNKGQSLKLRRRECANTTRT